MADAEATRFTKFKRWMGGRSSTSRTTTTSSTSSMKGCWRRTRPRGDEDDVYGSAEIKRPSIARKFEPTIAPPTITIWEEVPTPTSEQMFPNGDDLEDSGVFSDGINSEKLMQIIRCFPFQSPRSSPRCPRKQRSGSRSRAPTAESECCLLEPSATALNSAFGRLVQVSVETMAITALPRESIDKWLKERLKKWVQLSGHEGSIVPASSHTLYKKQASNRAEGLAYEAIAKDPKLVSIGFTPRFYRQIEKNEESFIEIEDLLAQFADPSQTAIMDIKIGSRTFLESEVTNTKLRPDLYDKMIAIDPDEPTEEEHKRKSITKLRYMQFREQESSSSQLGFRIEAAKMPGDNLQKNFKRVRSWEDVSEAMSGFFGNDFRRVRNAFLTRLRKMRDAVEDSQFFQTHEVVGSSILLMYDREKVGIWAIDFAKSTLVDVKLTHREPWTPGNHEDGYLTGFDNLIQIIQEIPVINGACRR